MADPFWDFKAPGCVDGPPYYVDDGLMGWYNSYNLGIGTVPTSVPGGQVYVGFAGVPSYLGHALALAGDGDQGVSDPNATGTPSWDFLFGNARVLSMYPMDTSPIDFGLLPHAQFYAPFAPLLRSGYTGGSDRFENLHGNQLCSVGDINLNGANQGADDYAFVAFNYQDVEDLLNLRHEVHVGDGRVPARTNNPPGVIYSILRDPVADRELLGTPDDQPTWDPFNNIPRRTTVSRLGDVDGDGLDDFGVVSGYADEDPYGVGEAPDYAVVLVCGTRTPAQAPGGSQSLLPELEGNRVAQRGSRIAVRILNCPPGANVTLYEDTSTLSPGVSECGTTRTVGGTTYLGTANSLGEFFFTRDLDYDSPDPNETTLGTAWYYQAKVDGYSGAFGCRMSNVRIVRIVDSSCHLDESLGDS